MLLLCKKNPPSEHGLGGRARSGLDSLRLERFGATNDFENFFRDASLSLAVGF